MELVTSGDGTKIAYERAGSGPPIVFVTGAFNDHTRCAGLAAALSGDFTTITYDRRARGASGDTRPYATGREVEDLAALIEVAGGSAAVFGYSSGGLLALRAAADGVPITHLAVFEAPCYVPAVPDMPARLDELVQQGRRGDAVTLFQVEGIGLPPEVAAQIRQSPMFPALEAMAQSTVYDATVTAELSTPAPVSTPTLVLNGSDTWPILRTSAQRLAAELPGARHEELPSTDHDIPVAETATALRAFLR
jgi:pimeloyl-ACP methyl ester carboxylesterase